MTKQKENVPIIFTLSLGGKDEILQRVNKKEAEQKISVIALKPNKESNISDKDRILREIIEESGRRMPILNIQHPSNDHYPIFDLQDLTNFEILGIKTSLTFGNYKPLLQNPKLENIWKELLAKVEHVFFANEQDQNYAISHGDIAREKTTNIQTISDANSVISKILQKPVNILISGSLPDKAKLDELVKTAKNQNSRIVIKSNPLSVEGASNAIALKFGIENPEQLFGIKLEVEEILKDQTNGAKNLEKYVSQLSEQFQKDLSKAEINPVDIYFDLSDKQKISNMEKGMSPTLPSNNDQSPSSLANKNIPNIAPLQGAIKPEAVEEYNPRSVSFFRKVFNYFKEIVSTIKEIFGKKQEESKTMNAQLTTPSNKTPWEEIGITQEEYTKSIQAEQQLTKSTEERRSSIIAPPISSISIAPNSTQDKGLLLDISAGDIDNVKKANYLYEDYQIQHILKGSLDENKVSIQPAISLASNPSRDEIVTAVLNNTIAQVKAGKEAAVIPIETGGEHWTGLIATYNKENEEVTFTYNDPIGTPIENRPELLDLIKKAAPTAIIVDLETPQQENAHDCGVFVCDNLIKLAKGQEILSTDRAKNMGIELRKAQAGILSQEFAKQQAKEVGNNMNMQDSSFTSRINTGSNNKERTRG
ncbi:Ulp1 family isopeptidase [Rickettsia endosymbiont of Polydrusus tereticollis]|uniref:Ulp1 family isopeptidase n=1 Tax=Rickettsia endosymbiont of Polydrusus tereticollis TaxID=3066251 RepID=UPI003132BB8E